MKQLEEAQATEDAATEQVARMANVVRALSQQVQEAEQRAADSDHSTADAHRKAIEAEELVWSLEQERTELEEKMEEMMEMNEELEQDIQRADLAGVPTVSTHGMCCFRQLVSVTRCFRGCSESLIKSWKTLRRRKLM